MKRLAILILMFSTYSMLNAQSLKGTVTDAETGESIPMANVVVKFGKTIVQAGASNFDGNFLITPLSPGVFSVEVSYIGFEVKEIANVKIERWKETELNITLEESGQLIGCPIIWEEPIIDPFISGVKYSLEDIREKPLTR